MSNTRVMVVDDSAAMRALFCGILENAKGIDVCGTACNASEARDKMSELSPDVLTLDVEMPGMSGLDFLREIMETSPMPVIMLSSITQEGTGTTQKALELGAVHCFPKPLNCSGTEFDETVKRLGDIVLRAARGEPVSGDGAEEVTEPESYSDGAESSPCTNYVSDGKPVVIACGIAGLAHVKQMVANYPPQCPPTVVIVNAPRDAVEGEIAALASSAQCTVEMANHDLSVEPGKVILAPDGTQHVMIESGAPLRIRMVDRDPIGGFRPSADLLFGSLVRSQVPALAGLMTGPGMDGTKGMQMLGSAGNTTFAQRPDDAEPQERFDAATRLGVGTHALDADAILPWLLEQTSQG